MGLVLSLVSVLCAKQNELQEEQTQYPAHQQRPQQQPQQHAYHSHIDSNQVNQHNPQYTALRASARDEGDKMAHCFQLSHEAYARGDGAAAKQLSNDGKQHQKEMERLNKEASEWIFKENNTDSQAGEIDLHGLYVKEAIHFTDIALQDAKRRGDSQVRLIVGKGLHSQGGVVKIKPAIEELMIKLVLFFYSAALLIATSGTNSSQNWIQTMPECLSCRSMPVNSNAALTLKKSRVD